ncbi:hypothetical protein AB3S75_012778 [Citrus x aurantiifolia]
MERDTTVMTCYNYGELCDDLLVETLSRLPVKSLMRLRCVSRSWFSLVKDPKFICKHLTRGDHNRLMVYNEYYIDNYPVEDFVVVPDNTMTDLHFQNLEAAETKNYILLGPYEGIICFSEKWNRNKINVWNISMNEYRILPEPPRPRNGVSGSRPSNTVIFCCNFAVGLDPMSNDFKLVLIQTLHDERGISSINDCLPNVAVYNFSTNSWRHVEEGLFPMRCYLGDEAMNNVYHNGFCYWVATTETPCDYVAILSFSMSEEVFQEMRGPRVPPITEEIEFEYWTIGVHDDYLSLLHVEESRRSFGLWMMKGGFWTKHLSFGPFIECYHPDGFWRNGEFILESYGGDGDCRLVLYDSNHDQIREFGITGVWFSVRILKESLITVRE